MIVAFFGHSEIYENKEDISVALTSVLNSEIKNEAVDFYLGAMGEFDSLALRACTQFKLTHPNVTLYFVTPYIDDKYLALRNYEVKRYDGTIYPPLESVPPQYAIIERNKWIVNQADLVIAYVNHSWGGATKALEYTHKVRKRYINLGDYIPL